MSVTPHPDLLQAGVSPGSVQTLASRPRPPPTSNPMASKRVCFYKSGDPQFGGLRMVINGRTFKTFDALLDALSKKVPLPFGVRTITTPRGINSIRALEELQDGGSYVCSDRKRVKPLNIEKANRRQVPWNTTRPLSARRRGNLRQIPRRIDFGSRAERVIDRAVAVRTPKRLVVYKNRDPAMKRIVVLQRRTAPTFDALLDYLSQIMQFPVVKLFTPDGRRVEGLAGLILCSGVAVAAGNEPFRLSNFNFQGGPPTIQSGFPVERIIAPPQIYTKKTPTSSTRSRNFSLSSERYFVNQIKKTLSESLSEHESHHSGSLETELNRPTESVDMEPCNVTAGVAERDCPVMPTEDDIEKSFRVNQDGSMTVEMKVRLTVKQEEMIHWTTTLSRTSVSCQHIGVCDTQPMSGPNSPDVNNDSSRNAGGHSAERPSEGSRHLTSSEKTVAFKECGAIAENSNHRNHKRSTRTPTPGARHLKSKSASVENVATVTETEVQESTVGTYSYMERTSEGEITEGYCVVSRSSTSNVRPVPKPRKTGSAGSAKQSTLHSSLRASGVSEVLQVQNSGLEVTETVMHIYESQPHSSYDNYLANPQHTAQKGPSHNTAGAHSKPGSTDSGPCSSNNDCDVDLTRMSSASGSNNGRKDEMFSLSSESMAPPQRSRVKSESGSSKKTADGSSSANENASKKSPGSKKKRTAISHNKNTSPLSSGSDKKQRLTTLSESSKTAKKTNSPDKTKTGSSAESAQSRKSGRGKKTEKDNGGKVSAHKSSSSALSAEQVLNLEHSALRDLAHNLNSPDSEKLKKPLRKNVQDILESHPLSRTKSSVLRQKSMSDDRVKSPKQNREMSESISLPLLCDPPSVQQYVENWLQQIQPDTVPYIEELSLVEAGTKKGTFQESNDNSLKESVEKNDSEILSDEEENLSAEDKSEESSEQQQPILVCSGGQLTVDESQRMRGFCRSMPSVRIHPVDQDGRNKLHQSAEILFPLDTSPSEDVEENSRGVMKPVLQQLCSSLQSMRRAVLPTQTVNLEKAHSLPDFSEQVASVFGASSTKLLSFLSVMTLKDRSLTQESIVRKDRKYSYPEALKVMQSLEKLANTEDEEALRASLSDLHNSTSSMFQESWKDFREKYDIDDNPLPSPKNSEQEFILEVHSEASEQNKDQFDIEQLMEELSVSEELRQEISSLAEEDMAYHDTKEEPTGSADGTSHHKTPSPVIRENNIEDSEVVEVMSIAKMREDDFHRQSQGSPLVEECSIASKGTSHSDNQETGNKEEMSYCETTGLPSEHSEECVDSPRGSPVEECSEQKGEMPCSSNKIDKMIKPPGSVNSEAASPSADSPNLEASDIAKDESEHSAPKSEQEGVASTHEEGSPTVDPHSVSADEDCISEAALKSHDAGGETRTGSDNQEDNNSAEVSPSLCDDGGRDEDFAPPETDSSCHHSQVSEPKIKESVQDESEHHNSQELDMESVAQTEEAVTSVKKDNSTENLHAGSLSVSGSERKYLSSAESSKSQKTNKSNGERKGKKSEKSSVKSTSSSYTGTRKVLSSAEALHLGLATSRSSSAKLNMAGSQGSLSNVRKQTTPSVKKVTKKPKSLNEDSLKTPKECLSESVSMPFLCAPPSDVHQYVGSWLEKMQPDTIPYMEGTSRLEPEPERKAVFHIGTSSSEGSEGMMTGSGHFSPEEESLSAEERQEPTPVIQIRCDGELVEDGFPRMRSYCRSMPSVRIHPAEQDLHTRVHHKSTEALFPLENQPAQDTDSSLAQETNSSFKGGIKPVLQQLCASLQSIKRALSPVKHAALEKTSSLPDFSGQVASVFGASSNKFFSFLSVKALKDGSSSHGSQSSLTDRRSSGPEALKVIQSLEKLTNTENEAELRESLKDLRKSTSPSFQESWKDFQEKYDIEDTPLESPKNVEQEFALDVPSEAGDQNKDQTFGVEQLMEELSMSEELRQEISYLVEEEMSYHDAAELHTATTEEASHEETIETVVKTDDVEKNEQGEVMPVTNDEDDMEKAHSMDNDDDEELDTNQEKTIESNNSAGEEKSLVDTNETDSVKQEETGSRKSESEDIDNERFLTPITESETKDTDRESCEFHDSDPPSEQAKYESSHEDSEKEDMDRESLSKDLDRESESWKGRDSDHQSDKVKCQSSHEGSEKEDMDRESLSKDLDGESESWKGRDSDHQSEEAKCESSHEGSEKEDMDRESVPRDSESWKGNDSDHQLEEAKCQTHHENLDRTEIEQEECSPGDSHADEDDGHAQEPCDTGEETDILAEAIAEDKCCYKEEANNLVGGIAFGEREEYSHMGSNTCEQPSYPNVLHPVEISQELLDFVNKALLSSSLTFTYDSNGNLRIQPEIGEAKYFKETLQAKTNLDSQYGLKRLPSPNTSDLSDYRSDTADSGERKSQMSFNISTDVGEEEADRVSISQGQVDQNSEESYATEDGSITSPLDKKSDDATPKSDLKSMCSINSNQDSISGHQDVAYLNTPSSFNGDSESVQCLSFYSQTDLREGVLIDKGRWLLKENHLIRKSPPVSMGMYDQVDSSSADSGQDNMSEYMPSSQYLNHQSPLAVISSSELEEMAKPSTPKCTYFTIPHSSDSDPFHDYPSSSNGSKQGEKARRNRVSPQEQPSKTWAKKNSSFSSFASVEFKLADGKIHPEGGATVERSARSQTIGGRTLQEEDSTESLQLRCGQNCPIL